MFDEALNHPAGREVLERGNSLMIQNYGINLLDLAQKTDDPQEDLNNAQLLRMTSNTQPAVYLESIALHNVNKQLGKSGYRTTPEFYTGVSMGMGTAAVLAGFMDFETGFRFHAERGRIMQEESTKITTSMVALLATEKQVLRLLGQQHNSDLDLCLINSDNVWVIGGPDEPEDSHSPMQSVLRELKDKHIRIIDVDTDRAMHGRYVRNARPAFDKLVDGLEFKTPTSAVVGSLTGLPIRDAEQMKEELKMGFDHTVDNRKPLVYFDAAGIHVFSEVGSERGNFGRTMEKMFGSRKLQTAAAALGAAGVAAGIGIYEVMTKDHPHHPDHNDHD